MKLSDLIKYCHETMLDDPELMIEGQYCVPTLVTDLTQGITASADGMARYVLLERAQDEDDA